MRIKSVLGGDAWVTILSILTVCFFLANCASNISLVEPFPPEFESKVTPFAEEDAVRIAAVVAERHGINLGEYGKPFVSYSQGVWFVGFDCIEQALGCHFVVSIDEKNRNTFFGPGR